MDLQALMQAQAGLAAGQEAKPLLEFRAGIMELKDRTLTADPRRGRVIITSDDSLGAPMLKLQWQIRPQNNTDFQLLLMEKSATLTKVEGCKDGRVVQLKLDGGARRFFWLQEPKAEGDADILKKFDEIITKIPQRDPNEALAARLAMSDEDIPAEAFQQQFLSPTHSTATGQAPSGPVATIPPAASTPSTTTGAAPPAGVSADAMAAFTQLAQAFAARQGGAGAGNMNAAAAALLQQQRAQFEQQQQHSLNEVLDADRIQPLLQSDDAAIESLLQHLPDGHRTRTELWATLRSPQMHQTVGRINQILNSSQFGQLMASFSLPLGTNIGVPGLIEAIQRTAGNTETSTSTSTSSASTASSTSSSTDSSAASKPADSK